MVVDPDAGGPTYGYADLMTLLLPATQPEFLQRGDFRFPGRVASFVVFEFDEQHSFVSAVKTVGDSSRESVSDLPRVRTVGTYGAVDLGDEP